MEESQYNSEPEKPTTEATHHQQHHTGHHGFVRLDQPAVGVVDAPVSPTVDLSSLKGTDMPVPVVQVLSVRGVEYTMMTLLLWFVAGAFLGIFLSLFNGLSSFEALAFPIALLVVCLPLFALLFLRLRKAELADPRLRLDASKRRLSQFTQIITFAACLFTLIGFVHTVLQSFGGGSAGSIGKTAINTAVVLVIAGGIFAYYWFDEHRLVK